MLQSLQACRAAAAMLVVLFHLGGTFAQDKYFGFKAIDGPFAWGDAGVDFFFVLSGFLITAAHRRDIGRPQALRSYLVKRALRIYPTYWLVCGAVLLGALAVPSLREAVPADLWTLAKTFALVPQDPAVVGGTGAPILFVAWSMQYELLFYALVAVLIANRSIGVAAVAAVLAVNLGCGFGTGGVGSCTFPLSFLASNFVWLFAMGVASAYLVGSRLRVPRPLGLALASIVAIVAFGALEALQGRDPFGFDRRLVYGALSSAVIVGLARAESAGDLVLRQRWVGLLGDASYALYLVHIPVISVLSKLLLAAGLAGAGPAALVAAFVGVFLACVGSAVVFYRAVERPMLRRFRARLGGGRTTTGADAAATPAVAAQGAPTRMAGR